MNLPIRPSYGLACDDPSLAALLRTWLDESQLDWPGHVELFVSVVDVIPLNEDARESFPQPELLIQAGAPAGTVRIRWNDGDGEALIHATQPRVDVLLTPAGVARFDVAERGFLLAALIFALRRIGWYHIHCAALKDPTGRGWLFVAPSQSGKSTTSALLASNGWAVSTDDIAFLSRGDGATSLYGFSSPIALRAGGKELLGASGGLEFARRGKAGFSPHDLGANWIPSVTPEIVLFPSVGETTTVEPIGARAAMNAAIESSLWILFESVHAQEHLDALSRLIAQSRCFRAQLGPDLFDNPMLLQQLVS